MNAANVGIFLRCAMVRLGWSNLLSPNRSCGVGVAGLADSFPWLRHVTRQLRGPVRASLSNLLRNVLPDFIRVPLTVIHFAAGTVHVNEATPETFMVYEVKRKAPKRLSFRDLLDQFTLPKWFSENWNGFYRILRSWFFNWFDLHIVFFKFHLILRKTWREET